MVLPIPRMDYRVLVDAGPFLRAQRCTERQFIGVLNKGRGSGSKLRGGHWREFLQPFHRGTFAIHRRGIEPHADECAVSRQLQRRMVRKNCREKRKSPPLLTFTGFFSDFRGEPRRIYECLGDLDFHWPEMFWIRNHAQNP